MASSLHDDPGDGRAENDRKENDGPLPIRSAAQFRNGFLHDSRHCLFSRECSDGLHTSSVFAAVMLRCALVVLGDPTRVFVALRDRL